MDPNVTLAQLREYFARDARDTAASELFTALDGWLSRGGFPPDAWLNSALSARQRTMNERA